MKNLEEIDCNESIWGEITSKLKNGWGGFENECRFAFRTKDKTIDTDVIECLFWTKYPSIDQIEVERITLKKADYDDYDRAYNYFGVSIIIYESGI